MMDDVVDMQRENVRRLLPRWRAMSKAERLNAKILLRMGILGVPILYANAMNQMTPEKLAEISKNSLQESQFK